MTGFAIDAGSGNAACAFLTPAASARVQSNTGAPETIPSKSSGNRCASMSPWRPAARAAHVVGVVRVAAVILPDDGLGGFGGAMHSEVTEIQLPLEVLLRPSSGDAVRLVPGIGAGDGEPAIDRAAGAGNAADEAAAPEHEKPAVPVVGQPHGKADLATDEPGGVAVRRVHRTGGGRIRTGIAGVCDADGRPPPRRQRRAPIRGGGRGRPRLPGGPVRVAHGRRRPRPRGPPPPLT